MSSAKNSFIALLNAFESVEKPEKPMVKREPSPSPCPTIQPVETSIPSRKRKHIVGNSDSNKRSFHNLTDLLQNSILSDEKDRKKSKNAKSHIRYITKQTMTDDSIKSKIELESKLQLLQSQIPNDSFEDLCFLVGNINELMDAVGHLISNANNVHHLLNNFNNFIRIIREMQNFTIDFDCENIFESIKKTKEFLYLKSLSFKDSLREDCLGWRVLGYPVKDVENIIRLFQNKVFTANTSIILRVYQGFCDLNTEANKLSIWERPLTALVETIEIISSTVKLIGNAQLIHHLYQYHLQLVSIYLSKSLDITRLITSNSLKFPDSKILFIYENAILILDYSTSIDSINSNLSTQLDQFMSSSTNSSSEQTTQESIAALPSDYYHGLVIELGLELCSYYSLKRPIQSEFKSIIYHLIVKYLESAGRIMHKSTNLGELSTSRPSSSS